MAKSFRRFREDQYEDEWGNDDEFLNKKNRLKERKMKQKQKNNEKMSSYESKDEEND
jgi:hypothetical protein